jgi:DNA helicase II / ATP-dependent DNA helicase PcrA
MVISDIGRNKVQDWARRRRSFSIFQCPENDAAEIAVVLSDSIRGLTIIHSLALSDLPETSGPVLLQSVGSKEAYTNADALHRLVLRLTRWEDEAVFLLSPDSQDKWERGNLWLGNGKVDRRGLYLDALTLVLRQDNVNVPDLMTLDSASDQPEMTYIEQHIAEALDKEGISFKAQALMGRYHVDFLVEKDRAQVVVECDGKAYHSSDKEKEADRKRDLYLLERGYRVLRFTAGDINGKISWCVEQIKRALNKSQVDKSRRLQIDDDLDNSQKQAVFASPGEICVLAPAGSGKTKVLTNRAIHLVNEGFREKRVLALAFNRVARLEMQNRLGKIGFSEVDKRVHTFNSYGANLPSDVYNLIGKGFDPKKARKSLGEKIFPILETKLGELKKVRGSRESLLTAIERVKRELSIPGEFIQPECRKLLKESCPSKRDQIWSQIFEQVLQWQIDSDNLTFADHVYLAVRRLAEDAIFRRNTQMTIDALLIDEFQDLDAAQRTLTEILVLGHGNMFVVGDDDQMIYGWRGADIGRFRQFLDAPNTRKITLPTNYRSSQLLVRHAGYLISHNKDREGKDVRPKIGASTGKVALYIGNDLAEERAYLKSALTEAHKEGFKWKELAVLVRYRELYHPVLEELRQSAIPVDFRDKAALLYSTRAARAITGYFKAVLDWPSPPKSVWREILNAPNRYISNDYVDQIGREADPVATLSKGNDLTGSQRDEVRSLLNQLEEVNGRLRYDFPKSYDLFQRIDTTFGLTSHFKQESGVSDDNEAADYGLLIDQLREQSKQFPDPRGFLAHCEAEKEKEAQFAQREDSISESSDKDAVALMTIHKAKGKEWRGVVLFHQEWRKPNSFESASQEETKHDVEEERRVVYVGATRAIEALWVTAERGKRSIFVDELFRDPEFRENNTSKELRYRQDRLEKTEREIIRMQEERNKQQLTVDRAQGIDLNSVERKLAQQKRSMSLLKRLLSWIGVEPSRTRQLKSDFAIAQEGDQAEQRIREVDHRITGLEDRKYSILEEIDRLKREEKFRRILSDPIEER